MENIIPTTIQNLQKYPQELWINIISASIELQATIFDEKAIEFACNPQVCNTYKECAAYLRSMEQNKKMYPIIKERILEREKEMGVTR